MRDVNDIIMQIYAKFDNLCNVISGKDGAPSPSYKMDMTLSFLNGAPTPRGLIYFRHVYYCKRGLWQKMANLFTFKRGGKRDIIEIYEKPEKFFSLKREKISNYTSSDRIRDQF